MRLLLAAVFLAIFVLTARAADKEKPGRVPEPPPPVEHYNNQSPAAANSSDAGALTEPVITITPGGEEVTITPGGEAPSITTKDTVRHEEYRIGGRLYMVKVFPKKGRPYYLVDSEGEGNFVRSDFQPTVSPPMWVIKRF